MNFASKKLNGFYTNTSDTSTREEALLAENKKLKRKNKRLSTAMLYLVDQIEVRIPLWGAKKTAPPVTTPSAETTATVETAAPNRPLPSRARPKPAREKIIGKAWLPEKLDHIPGEQPVQRKRSQPLSMQQIFAKKTSEPPTLSKEAVAEPLRTPQKTPTPSAVPVKPADETAADEQTPDLAPHEVTLLAAPTKENPKEDTLGPSAELLVEREPKKTSAKEASLTYLAVSIASAPVPEAKTVDDNIVIDHQVAHQTEMMREAMLRRVNRLRW